MKSKFFFACCAAAASVVLLGGIVSAQEKPRSRPKDATGKIVQGDEASPKRSVGESIRGRIQDWRQRKSGDSQTEQDDLPAPPQNPLAPQLEAPFLRDLAAWLSVPIPENAPPGDISFAIQQALAIIPPYSGEVFSDESFKKYKAAFLTKRDAETFEAYHAFLKKVAGKKVILINYENF